MIAATTHSTKHRTANIARGFTLIELLVVTGVIVVVSSIVLANHSTFGGVVTLRNLAYDVALTMREAQTYGLSVRQFQGSGTFTAGYGMHVLAASPTTYVLFADAVSQNGRYDNGELVESVTIRRGFYIADLCIVPPASGTEVCGIQQLDIVFMRPEPDAHIQYNQSQLAQTARIVLESPRGDRASVLVQATGQISVEQ